MGEGDSSTMPIDEAVSGIEESKSFGSLSMSMDESGLMLSLSASSDSHSISSKGMKLSSISEEQQEQQHEQHEKQGSRGKLLKQEEREQEPEGRDDVSSHSDGRGRQSHGHSHSRSTTDGRTSVASNASRGNPTRPTPKRPDRIASASKPKSSQSPLMKGQPAPPHHQRPPSAYGHGHPPYGHGPPQQQPRHQHPPSHPGAPGPHMAPPHPGAPYGSHPPYGYGGPPPHPHYQQPRHGPHQGPPGQGPRGPPYSAGPSPGPPPHGYPHPGHPSGPPPHPHSMPPHHHPNWNPYPPQHGGHPYPPPGPHYNPRGGPPQQGGPPPPGPYHQSKAAPSGHQHGGGAPAPAPSSGSGGGDKMKVGGEHGSPSMSVSSSSISSTGSRKKRTIDGIRDHMPPHSSSSAFALHHGSDGVSTCSTASTGKRTNVVEEGGSPYKSKGGMLPPRSAGHVSLFSDEQMRHHRRTNSSTSTASSLSVGGMSMSSLVGKESNEDDTTMLEASPKRRRHQLGSRHHYKSSPSSSSTRARLDHLSVKDEPESHSDGHHRESSIGSAARLTLSASPINHIVDPGKTPVSKNTSDQQRGSSSKGLSVKKEEAFDFGQEGRKIKKREKNTASVEGKNQEQKDSNSNNASSAFRKKPVNADSSSSTPALYTKRTDSLSFDLGEMMNDDPLLNRHLRGQSFTPLPHVTNGSDDKRRSTDANSPTFNPALSSIAPQLSWSISGTPTLGDIAEWADVKPKQQQQQQRETTISPMSVGAQGENGFSTSMSFWQDDEVAAAIGDDPASKQHENNIDELSGKMTPLPIFFDQAPGSEERENMGGGQQQRGGPNTKYIQRQGKTGSSGRGPSHGDTEHIHQMFVSNGGREGRKLAKPSPQTSSRPMPLSTANSWGLESPHHHPSRALSMSKSPHYQSSEQRDDAFSRGRGGGGRRDGPPPVMSPNSMFGPHPGANMMGQGDRVRNLRGRAPHGAPPSLHIPPHMSSSHHHNLTSPMVGGMHKPGLWGSPHGAHPAHHHLPSPHHLSSPHMHGLDLTPSKRKCIPLKPPIPSKFQGDVEKMKGAQVPEFTSLVNFPVHISQKQAMNLPDGMRCCVMCGQACPCSAATKNKKSGGGGKGNKGGDNSAAGHGGGPAHLGGNSGQGVSNANPYAIIPTQNKGLCTMCDVNVWIVVQSGLEIKWCKGCKNFRPWAAFGDKGLATKCVRCRERQREKYAAQKEEKEKARLIVKNGGKPIGA